MENDSFRDSFGKITPDRKLLPLHLRGDDIEVRKDENDKFYLYDKGWSFDDISISRMNSNRTYILKLKLRVSAILRIYMFY